MRTHGWGGHPPIDDDEAVARILAATRAVIDAKGAATSLTDVARHLGVTRQTVYRYFPSTVDLLAAKDESSLVEQLNLAQTVLSGKPDALLLSPQSDTNLVPVIEAAKKLNIPTVIIDDARTEGASTYVGTDQVAIGVKAADFLGIIKVYT